MAGDRGSTNVVGIDRARARREIEDRLLKRIEQVDHKLDLCFRAADSMPTDPDASLAAKNYGSVYRDVVSAWRTVTEADRRSR